MDEGSGSKTSHMQRKEKKMEGSKSYPNIDMIRTGLKLKSHMERLGLSVKDIQEYLNLSCPQPIYRWFNGKILPSVDHLLALSELFNVHMEELLVRKCKNNVQGIWKSNVFLFQKRIITYFKLLSKNIA